MLNLKSEILNGRLPSEVFRDLLANDDSLTNSELASMFKKSFPNVSGEALQVIWKWKGPKNRNGIDDEKLNKYLLSLLDENS